MDHCKNCSECCKVIILNNVPPEKVKGNSVYNKLLKP
jgi:hypothetical protein